MSDALTYNAVFGEVADLIDGFGPWIALCIGLAALGAVPWLLGILLGWGGGSADTSGMQGGMIGLGIGMGGLLPDLKFPGRDRTPPDREPPPMKHPSGHVESAQDSSNRRWREWHNDPYNQNGNVSPNPRDKSHAPREINPDWAVMSRAGISREIKTVLNMCRSGMKGKGLSVKPGSVSVNLKPKK